MTTLSTDNFTRANQSAWGTASDGESWSQVRGSATWAITSNKGTVNSAGGTFNIFRIGTQTPGSTDVLVRVTPADTTSNTGCVARYSSTANFYYGVLTNGSLVIGKDSSGSFSTISSAAFSYSAGTAYWLRFHLVGTSLSLKAWADGSGEPGSYQVNTTDSTFSTGGYGLATDSSSGTNTQFDSLTVTDGTVTSTRTITPVTVALKTTLSRTVSETAALKTTNSRTVSDTTALKTTNQRTVPESAALKTTNTRTIPASAALLTTHTRAVPDSAALKTTNSRTIPDSAALKTTSTRTISETAALKTTNARTIPETAALKVTSSRTIGASVALKTTRSRVVGASATLLTSGRIVPCTAALSRAFVANAMLIVRSGETTLALPSGHATLTVRSGETTLSIT